MDEFLGVKVFQDHNGEWIVDVVIDTSHHKQQYEDKVDAVVYAIAYVARVMFGGRND